MKALKPGVDPAVAVARPLDQLAAVKAIFVPLSYQAAVNKVYQNLFGQNADPVTNAYWTAQQRAGVNTWQMVTDLANTTDAVNATSNAAYVVAAQYTLGKAITNVDAIAAPLNAEQITLVQVVEQIDLGQ